MYGNKYGRSRDERASRMYLNIPPKGYAKPPCLRRHFRSLGIIASFDNNHMYVENLENIPKDRSYIVVRSQKTTSNYIKYYFIELTSYQNMKAKGRASFMGTCTCKDRSTMCKHKLALLYTVQGNTYNLRRF